jgi:alpha-ribazole phosphatase
VDFLLGYMARKLLLLRHGETGKQYMNRYIGSTDIPLSEEGKQQAGAIKEYLCGHMFDRLICSPMLRCRETAMAILESGDIGFEIDRDLREIDFGQWEGMSFDDIVKTSPEPVQKWAAFDPEFAFPGGERIGDFLERIKRISERVSNDPADTILLCTHGGVIRTMICHFLKLKPWQYILFMVKPASLTTIELFDNGGVISGLSETGRL